MRTFTIIRIRIRALSTLYKRGTQVSFSLHTLVQMLLVFIHETASFGNFLHRTAFHGIRKLMKLLDYWKRHMTSASGSVSVDHTIQVDHMGYWVVVVHVAQQLLLTVSNLKGSPHS